AQEDSHSGAYLRRATVGVDGRAYGFDFTVNEDFSNINEPADGLRDVWLAYRFGAGGTLFIGQHKPWRSLDEMGSSSTIALEENSVASSNGLYGGRSYTQGLYYSWSGRHALA